MDKKDVVKQATSRTDLIDKIIAGLDATVSDSQQQLLRLIVDDFVDQLEVKDGKILNSLKNKRLLTLIDQVYQKYSKTAGLEIVKGIVDGVQQITDFNSEYFSIMAEPAKLVPIKDSVNTLLKTWLGIEPATGNIKPNGYLDILVKDATVKNAIMDMVVRQISGGSGYKETKAAVKDFIIGNPGKTGALNKYYRNFVYDAFSQIDRATSQTYADGLGLDYAIFEGGLIKTSRQWCKEHNGKVYTRAEIADFDPGDANKQPGYNPFTDLGGYGCRHHLNWIPKALAVAMRPELASANDKPAEVPAKTKPAKEAPVESKPPTPVKAAPKRVTFDNVKTPKEFKEKTADLFEAATGIRPAKMGSLSTAVPLSTFIKYGNQLASLTAQYKPFAGIKAIKEVAFKSTKSQYGSISHYGGKYIGTIVKANFGDRLGDAKTRTYVPGADATRFKSRVDADKLALATVTHEFAHFIATTEYDSPLGHSMDSRVAPFWADMRAARADYHKELLSAKAESPEALYEISLGKYASTNVDEFFAEGFTEYHLSSKPSKYAKKIGEIVDKHFKR
jgi:hypothetical protein